MLAEVLNFCSINNSLFSQLEECKALQPKTGDIVPCLVENKNHIQNTRCKHVVSKLAQILFSDYRLLKGFYKVCTGDVKKFQCGRVDALEEGVSRWWCYGGRLQGLI